MIFRQVECPHCGNEITVKSIYEVQKCKWCRRLVKATFHQKGRKIHCEVEPMDFPDDNNEGVAKRSLNDWEDRNIYGIRRH